MALPITCLIGDVILPVLSLLDERLCFLSQSCKAINNLALTSIQPGQI